jgi:hypothetical protein
MKNIYILLTDKPSRLHLWFDKLELSKEFLEVKRNKQNIYITNDEEIKEGYYFDLDINKVLKYPIGCYNKGNKKIILTTDGDLIKDGVQAIDDEFLEWFVKNPSCEEVDVVFNNRGITGTEKILKTFGEYKIIIPKEEPKQETLEEAFEFWSDRQSSYDKLDILRFGAVWQQEQILDFLYSEITERRDYSASKMCEKVIEFIEQFKNK